MRRLCWPRLFGVVILVIGLGLFAPGPLRQPVRPVAAGQSPVADQPHLFLTGLQLANQVRYAVSLARPAGLGIANLQVAVTLPADAESAQSLQTLGRTVFLGNTDGTLTWAAPGYEPNEPSDAFSFTLSRPSSGAFMVHATWTNDDGTPGDQALTITPAVVTASATTADVTLSGGTASGDFVTAGATGVQLRVLTGSIPDGTVLHIRVPGADENPPAGAGSPWWCSEVSVTGLPSGAALVVQVPTRQALPAGQPVELFGQQNGDWQPLSDEGQASADGQFVRFTHRGGTVAAGTSARLQSTLSATTPAKLSVSVKGTFVLRNFQSGLWSIVVKNTGGTATQQVYVEISQCGDDLSCTRSGAIDYSDIQALTLSGSVPAGCDIVQGSGLFGARAECTALTLPAGKEIKASLQGGISLAGSRAELIAVQAVGNYSEGNTPYGDDWIWVEVNP